MSYILSCCSTADLTREHLESRAVKYIYFHYYIDDVEYPDDMGKTIRFDKFYQMMEEGVQTRTSQINAEEFIEYFTPYLKKGKDIVHVCLSSGLSGVYNSATVARDILKEEFPERKIYIVDSLAGSSGYGLLMDKLADLRDSGMSAEEVVAWAEDNKLRLNHWFFSTDLKYFVRGGRISKASGLFGTLLKICPLLNVSNEGKLVPKEKIRLKKNAIAAAFEKMKQYADKGADYDGKCYISCSACENDAKAVAELIEGYFPKMDGKVQIMSIGTTIGSHTGPGTVALFFWGKDTNRE